MGNIKQNKKRQSYSDENQHEHGKDKIFSGNFNMIDVYMCK